MFATIEKLQSDNSNIERFIENTKKYLEPKDMIIAEIAATQRNLNALLVEKTHRVQQLGETNRRHCVIVLLLECDIIAMSIFIYGKICPILKLGQITPNCR